MLWLDPTIKILGTFPFKNGDVYIGPTQQNSVKIGNFINPVGVTTPAKEQKSLPSFPSVLFNGSGL